MSATGDPYKTTAALFSTFIEWPFGGRYVQVYCSGGGEWTPLQCHGQKHYVTLHLPIGVHDIYFNVDGENQFHPEMLFRNFNGRIINTISVNPYPRFSTSSVQKEANYQLQQPQAIVQNQEDEVLVPITFKHYFFGEDDRIKVEGSWDLYKKMETMERSNDDHYLIKSLKPGQYPYKYIVNGERRLDRNVQMGHRSNGTEGTNILIVSPDVPNNEPLVAGSMLLDEFLGNVELTTEFKFSAGAVIGSIAPDEESYPCSEAGLMIMNGFFTCARENYLRKLSWAGCFKLSDMVVVDGRHCQIRKKATFLLTRVNLLLDNHQMKNNLLLRYQRRGKFPPHFSHLFWLLENPPIDFDTNSAARIQYLDCLWKAAALATSSQ